MKVIILRLDIAEAISQIIHRMEEENPSFFLKRGEDEAWANLTEAILKAVEVA